MKANNKVKFNTALRNILLAKTLDYKDFIKGTITASPYEETDHETGQYSQIKLLVIAHIFYERYLERFLKTCNNVPKGTRIYVTTSNKSIANRLKIESINFDLNITVILVPNIGRNFAPMFVELIGQIRSSDVILHIHSKESRHSSRRNFGLVWADKLFEFFENKSILDRALKILTHDERVGVIFPNTFNMLRGLNFRWGINLQKLENFGVLFKIASQPKFSGRFPFPAGGMFLLRTKAASQLFEQNWTYENFDHEDNQIDGTLQHAIERLIGVIVMHNGFLQVAYNQGTDNFQIVTCDLSSKRRGRVV